MTWVRGNKIAAAVCALFVALCIWYNATLPLYEGFDEPAHYVYINWLADNRRLPDLKHELPSYEAYQPPLYYIATALIVTPFDRADFSAVYRFNKTHPPNMGGDYLISDAYFPPSGSALASRVARLFSTLLGVLSLLLVYRTVRLLRWRDADLNRVIPLLTLVVLAFNPKFIRTSSTITNDIGVVLQGALHLYLAVRMIMQPQPPSALQAFGLGATLGAAMATKYNGIMLAASAALTVLWCWVKFGRRMSLLGLRPAAISVLGFALTGGVYFAYNLSRYDDILGWSQANAINDSTLRAQALNMAGLLQWAPYTFATYWGGSGFEFRFPAWANNALLSLLALTCAGAALAARRRGMPREGWVLLAVAAAAIVANIWWTVKYIYPNLRYLAPAYTAFAVGVAFGSVAWLSARWRAAAAWAVGGGHLAAAILVPLLLVIPEYASPVYLSPAAAQSLNTAGRVGFDNGVELLYAEMGETHVDPGQPIQLSLYWRARKEIVQPHMLTIDVFDEDTRWLGRFSSVESYARRHQPMSWRVGETLKLDYVIPVSVTQQSVGRIFAGWYEVGEKGAVVRQVHLDGTSSASAHIGVVKLRGARTAEQPVPGGFAPTTFDGLIDLEGVARSGDEVRLFWRARAEPRRNFTVFVHGLDASGAVVMQRDEPFAYSAHLWDSGEQVVTTIRVPGLAQAHGIRIGLYEAETGRRLSAQKSDGSRWPDDGVTP